MKNHIKILHKREKNYHKKLDNLNVLLANVEKALRPKASR